MKYLYAIVFQLIVLSGFAQKMFSEQESDCPLEFILEDKEMYIQYNEGDSVMVQHFFEGTELKHLDKLRGVIMLQVMVDTSHQVCLVSYSNESNLFGRRLDVPSRVLNMKGWKRYAPAQLKNENICALVMIFIDTRQITVQRIGYNRNSGKTRLSSTTFNRFKEEEKETEDTNSD